jgi:hypothetical protein
MNAIISPSATPPQVNPSSPAAALQMKLFRALGGEEQRSLSRDVNTWLANARAQGIEVVKTETAMCSVGASEDIFQHMVVVVWYSRAGRT